MAKKNNTNTLQSAANRIQSKQNKEEVGTNGDQLSISVIEKQIFRIRDEQVMIDIDLAKIYGIENRSLRQAVRRNMDKFPEDFLFRLSKEEANDLIFNGVSQNVIPSGYNTGGAEMFAFTEHGVAMLATILRSPNAKAISIAIIRAFVAMRRFLLSNAQVFQRLDRIEYKQIEADHRIDELFRKIDERTVTPKQGIFFDGQIYDAYEFICGLIKSARTRIVLIDNYVDETVLTMLDKREAGVAATIYTQKISAQFQLDLTKHNAQYPAIDVRRFTKSHDRFLILDSQVYLVGASLKDLGKKWFAVSLMSETDPEVLLSRLNTCQ